MTHSLPGSLQNYGFTPCLVGDCADGCVTCIKAFTFEYTTGPAASIGVAGEVVAAGFPHHHCWNYWYSLHMAADLAVKMPTETGETLICKRVMSKQLQEELHSRKNKAE